METRNLSHDVAVTAVSHPMRMDGARLRDLYDWAIASFGGLDKPPNTMEVDGPGFDRNRYYDFARGRKRLEAADLGSFIGVGCALYKQKRDSTTILWEFHARSLRREVATDGGIAWEPTDVWEASLCMFPDSLRLSQQLCLELATEFARRTVDEGGYVFFMHRNRGPTYYVTGMGFDYLPDPNDRTRAESENISTWSYSRDVRLVRPWLRDVYPVNFVGPRLAALPVQGVPFASWLREDPRRRGAVEPFPCRRERDVLLWRPPPDRIPALRERLYREGLVWDRQYYLDRHDRPVPPFVPLDPPPAYLRAEFYSGRDPRLTR